MADISKVRQKLSNLNKERWGLIESIMQTGKLLKASFYERYTKCGSPNCKCSQGDLHGPFPWIYRNRKGEKLVSTSCNTNKVEDARQYSENYKNFKEFHKKIQKVNDEIECLIAEIEDIQDVGVEIFVKKEGENRGRKSKNS